ncbi:site-2 protease family protein [Streptacidiphilus anmyonensis]|uniref:site-2 protease family protein n=1 Tax=Streptacidiphilus anmyonensis TaxID=405782 RepID=UPI000A010AF5|nr:site-2 protease family protein [Streptacidiphilus anmyonensis]
MSEFRSPTQGRGGERGPFRSVVPFGRVFGVPLRLHWSAPLLVVVLGLSLGAGTLPGWAPGRSHATYTLAGIAGALLLLASLLLHEGAHAVVARRAGVEVQDMTVWALGGATLMGRADRPRAAFKIAFAGPLTSLLLGGLGLGAAVGLLRGAHWTVPGDVLLRCGWANLLLAGFNLLPAAPLDGGRVLQAAVWWRTGDRSRAERAAGRAGQLAGALLIGIGVLVLLRGGLAGLWLMLLGFFITATAWAEAQQATVRTLLHGVRLSQVMSSPVATGPDWLTVDRFLEDVALTSHHTHLPVLGLEGRPTGVVSVRRLAQAPSAARSVTRVSQVAQPIEHTPLAGPEEDLADVLQRLTPGMPMRILVMDGGRLVGIVTAHDVSRLLQQRLTVTGRGSGAF